MDDKKKKYLKPEANIISFTGEEIITLSGGTETAGWDNGFGEDYEEEE